MKYAPFSFSSKDDLKLQGRAWMSQQIHPKGIIHLLHDLGEHSARFAHVGERFAEAGYHFVGFDLRGHGLSEGKRGHASSYIQLMDDIEDFLQIVENKFKINHFPRVLYGHGLGGNLAINYVLRRQPHLAAVIATNPMLKTYFKPSLLKIYLLKLIANLAPGLTFKNHIKSKELSRDLSFVKAYQDDVYIHDHVTARLALDIFQGGKYALKNAHNLHIPLLLMHGTADSIIPSSVSQIFAERAGNLVDLVLWEGFYHEIHNDFDKDMVIDKMITWLKKEVK